MKIGQFCQVINEAKLGEKFPPAAVGGGGRQGDGHCTSATLQTFHIFNTNMGASENKFSRQPMASFLTSDSTKGQVSLDFIYMMPGEKNNFR